MCYGYESKRVYSSVFFDQSEASSSRLSDCDTL
jgi:hypothetical protein